jgi:hypothetical protein
MNLKETGLEDVDWIHLAQNMDWLVESYEHSDEPLGFIKC